MADEKKTEEQLVAEQSTSGTGEPTSPEDAAGDVSTSSSRRGLLRWIAPVVLFVGTTLKPGTAQAADDFTGAQQVGRCTPRP